MAEHTPGPWLTEPGDTIICIRSTAEHGSHRIADVGALPYWKKFTGIDEANARLIAAAPDLLDAIRYSDDAHWTTAMRAAMAKALR